MILCFVVLVNAAKGTKKSRYFWLTFSHYRGRKTVDFSFFICYYIQCNNSQWLCKEEIT